MSNESERKHTEPYAFCEWCSERIEKESDAEVMRGEIICKECREAWDDQPPDGGF